MGVAHVAILEGYASPPPRRKKRRGRRGMHGALAACNHKRTLKSFKACLHEKLKKRRR